MSEYLALACKIIKIVSQLTPNTWDDKLHDLCELIRSNEELMEWLENLMNADVEPLDDDDLVFQFSNLVEKEVVAPASLLDLIRLLPVLLQILRALRDDDSDCC